MNDFNEEDYLIDQPYVDPISVSITHNGNKINFKCKDYEFDGRFWNFVSFPPQRGKKIIRIVDPSIISYMEILEPEDRPVKVVQSIVAIPSGPALVPSVSSGPVTYDAKGPQAIAEHRMRRALAKPAHDERGIPMSVTVNDVDGETMVNAAMVKA